VPERLAAGGDLDIIAIFEAYVALLRAG